MHRLPIYEVNGTARYLPKQENTHIRPFINWGFWPATDNDAILDALLQHEEDNFSKLMIENRS